MSNKKLKHIFLFGMFVGAFIVSLTHFFSFMSMDSGPEVSANYFADQICQDRHNMTLNMYYKNQIICRHRYGGDVFEPTIVEITDNKTFDNVTLWGFNITDFTKNPEEINSLEQINSDIKMSFILMVVFISGMLIIFFYIALLLINYK